MMSGRSASLWWFDGGRLAVAGTTRGADSILCSSEGETVDGSTSGSGVELSGSEVSAVEARLMGWLNTRARGSANGTLSRRILVLICRGCRDQGGSAALIE